jgi:hypothetical protein
MGGQVLADILMGRSQTGNAAPGSVAGLRTMSKSAPAYLRRDEPSLPFVTSYVEPVAEEKSEAPEEEVEIQAPKLEYGHGRRGRNTVTLDGVTYDLSNQSDRQTFDTEYAKQMKAYQDYQSSKWKKESKVQVEKLKEPKEEKLVSRISSRTGIEPGTEEGGAPSISRPQRRGGSGSPNYSYSIGDITSAPENAPRVISIEEKTVGTSKTPVISVEAPGAQRVFDLSKPEDLQSFMGYWKTRPLDEKVSLQVVGSTSLDALKYIPEDQVKMYAFWTNPVKTYGDRTFDFSTEEGKTAWKDFATSNGVSKEPEEWSQAPGFPVDTHLPRGHQGPDNVPTPVSWDVLKGTRLEGATPIAYQVYESLTKGMEQAKTYAEQKAADAGQGVTRYSIPKAPVSRYFNVQGEALKTVAAGDRSFSQKYTPASLQKMGERVAVGDLSPLARAIYLVMQSNKGITKSGLADAFGVTETDVDQAMVLVDKFSQGLVAKANAAVR